MKRASEGKTLGAYVAALCMLLGAAGSAAWAQQVQKVTSNRVKELLKAGKPVIGASLSLPSPPVAEILARCGFDFLWIDMEHSPLNLETVHRAIQATSGTDAVPIVRVPWNLHWLVKPVLDIGAMGVVIPLVTSKEEAVEAVRAAKYPPEGARGYGPSFAALRWGLSPPEYAMIANDVIMVIVLIEHIDAVNRIDEILAVPGIDVVFVGPFDLSGTMGLLGQTTDARVQEAVDRVHAAAKRARVPVGIFATTPDDINRRIQQGYQFVLVGYDTGFLEGGIRNILGQIRR
ncbi:MAG: aldolase/citrate lyase family protein [Bacteroidota bacterium]